MDIRNLSPRVSVAPQIEPDALAAIAARGFRTVVCHRPDGETEGQPAVEDMARAAASAGLAWVHQPVVSGALSGSDADAFERILGAAEGPILAYCRTGTRSASLWAMVMARQLTPEAVLSTCAAAGYGLEGLREALVARHAQAHPGSRTGSLASTASARHEVVVVGAGAGGLAVAASLLRRAPDLDVLVVDPSAEHHYQPGWTLVGGGAMDPQSLVRKTADLLPAGACWRQAAVAAFEPENRRIVLEDGERIGYRALVVAPGLRLAWEQVDGLTDTLGRNGVTSNYREGLAAYTWELVQGLQHGRAVFTQPPMPIKCAGAPQKALYLSADHWRRQGVLEQVHIDFCTAGDVLFGVPEYVPALQETMDGYGAHQHLQHTLVAVDGPLQRATFATPDGGLVEMDFDMLHVAPPQVPPACVARSPLADAAGWLDVCQETLQHTRWPEVFGVGDVCNSPNAKTAAAVRKQAPVVAENLLAQLRGDAAPMAYTGYGSCPLTVSRGRVVLAEFGYGGSLQPSLPRWLLDGTRPTRLGWLIKAHMLPGIYFNLMLKGREWLAAPAPRPVPRAMHTLQNAGADAR